MDLRFITLINLTSPRQPAMSNQKAEQQEHAHENAAENKAEEIRAKVEKILERLEQIEVEETWMKTWPTREMRAHRNNKAGE